MPPEKLYKYKSLEGDGFKHTQGIFATSKIYLPHVNQFNDPFEGKFRLHQELPEGDRYAKFLSRAASAIATWYMVGRVSDKACLFCLSERRDDILLWSHYAGCHEGICIEFDTTVEGSPFSACQKVEYRPEFNVIEGDVKGIFERACLVKAKHWDYELEWRLIRRDEQFVKFPKDCLTAVILGCRISEEDKKWVLDYWLRDYPSASIFEAKEVKGDIRLSVEPSKKRCNKQVTYKNNFETRSH